MGQDSAKQIEFEEARVSEPFSEEEWQELVEMDFGPSRAMWGTFAPLVLLLGAAIVAVAYLIAK